MKLTIQPGKEMVGNDIKPVVGKIPFRKTRWRDS